MNDHLIDQTTGLTKKERRELRHQEKLDRQQMAVRRGSWRRLAIWGGVIVGLVVIVWGLILLAGNSAVTSISIDGTIDPSDHVRGNPAANVVVIEYSDFQCPACKYYEPMLSRLSADFGDQIALVYRHFPLTTIHANAQVAAQAAEAAAIQGKFWEMHDRLFDQQTTWATERNPIDLFRGYAQELGLNVEQFNSDYSSREVRGVISRHVASARAANLPGTPSIFINGQLIDNPRDYESLQAMVQSALATGAAAVSR
ncbi:MAG: thioredoxin domain-containing protein [Patescibacteria group bacterium]